MTVESLLQEINRQHKAAFRLESKFAGGEQGAYSIVDGSGKRFVLKWHTGAGYLDQFRSARTATEHLASRGYPVPRYRFVGQATGAAYTIQSLLPGKPMGTFDENVLPHVLRLNDLQAGPAPLLSRDWPQLIVYSVLHGFDEYCVIDSLRTYSSTASELLDRLQAVVSAHADIDVETTDIVHFDFTHANILINEGEITGVIDWDGVMSGDRAFDLATLFFYTGDKPELQKRLWRHGIERSSPEAMRIYLAHLIVRQVDWSIRHHSRGVVEHWLKSARGLLEETS